MISTQKNKIANRALEASLNPRIDVIQPNRAGKIVKSSMIKPLINHSSEYRRLSLFFAQQCYKDHKIQGDRKQDRKAQRSGNHGLSSQ